MEVTGGQNLKTLLTRYLELGNLDKVHTCHGDALWSEETYCFWVEVNRHGGHGSQTLKTLLP